MYNTKPARQSIWNRMECSTQFDKQQRAIKLGKHRERVLSTHQAIDNTTPRCFKQYKTMRQRHKHHKEKEKTLDQQRRVRLSMLSPYKKHIKITDKMRKSVSTPHLMNAKQNLCAITAMESNLSSLSSISPSSASPSARNTRSEQLRNTMQQKPMHRNGRTSVHSTDPQSANHRSNKRLSISNSFLEQQKKIEWENEKLKKRLQEIRPSTYLNSIQEHWTLHSNIRKKMQKSRKKTVKCPDIIHTAKYKSLVRQQSRSGPETVISSPGKCNKENSNARKNKARSAVIAESNHKLAKCI